MKRIIFTLVFLALASHAHAQPAVESRFADVNGTRLHYLSAGRGEPVVLLHGYTQTSHMWRPLIAELAKTHAVIAPDLRGAGESGRPEGGYDKKTLAQDVHALAESLGHRPVTLVGHDIGLMVAYAYAAQYPDQVERIALLDAFLPGVGSWKDVWLLRDLWHFHFYGKTPLKLVAGRERIYFEHFWNDSAADRTRSVSEADRKLYTAAYAQQTDAGFTITAVHLDVVAAIPGADAAAFATAAGNAKAGCPVSRVLNAKITMDARLEA